MPRRPHTPRPASTLRVVAAVLGRVPQRQFLAARLAACRSARPAGNFPDPQVPVFDGGELGWDVNPAFARHLLARVGDETASEPLVDGTPEEAALRWEVMGVRGEAERTAMRSQAIEEQAMRAVARHEDALDVVEDKKRDSVEDLAAGTSAVPATLARDASERGRPAIPFPRLPWLLVAFVVATALVEGWQVAVPMANATGVDTSDLLGELSRNPMGTVLSLGFGLVTTAMLFACAEAVLAAMRPGKDPARVAWRRMRGAGGAALLVGMAWSVASMRDAAAVAAASLAAARVGGEMPTGGEGMWSFFILTLGVPLAGAWVREKAAALLGQNAKARRAQARWDAEREEERAQQERHAELVRIAQADLDRLAAERARVEVERRVHQDEVVAQERHRRELIDQERRDVERWWRITVAVLASDANAFSTWAHLLRRPELVERRRVQVWSHPVSGNPTVDVIHHELG